MKVFFPRYLNRNRLFYKLEYDEWLVMFGTGFAVFYLLAFFLMIYTIISLIATYFITRTIMKYYSDTHKNKSPGYLFHFFYNIGLTKPKGSENEKDIPFPYGFETEFKD